MSSQHEGPPGDGKPDPFVVIVVDEALMPIPMHSRAGAAYEELVDIMRERRGGWFAAFGRNLARNGKRASRILTHVTVGTVATVATLVLTGDIIGALTLGTTAGTLAPPAVSTTRLRRSRLVEHRRSYPDVPEFHDRWAVTAYEFTLMVRGYHLRINAVHRLRKLADQLRTVGEHVKAQVAIQTAEDITDLLGQWRNRLMEVDGILFQCQADDMEIYADDEGQEALRQIQPLKDGLFDWLILDPELIVPGKEREIYEQDLRDIASFQDVADAVDPYEAMRREQEAEEDKKE